MRTTKILISSATILGLLMGQSLAAQETKKVIRCDFELRVAISQIPGRAGRVISSEPFFFELDDDAKDLFIVNDGKMIAICKAEGCSLNYGSAKVSWGKKSKDGGYEEVAEINRVTGTYLRDITVRRNGSIFEKAEARGDCEPVNLAKPRF